MPPSPYLALSFYRFLSFDNLEGEKERLYKKLSKEGCLGRIYLAPTGINAQMSGPIEGVQRFIAWLEEDPRFADQLWNLQPTEDQIFPRLTVKIRSQLVALDQEVNLSQRGTYVTPQEWRELLQNQEKILKMDVRNRYEWEMGHFVGFEAPPCDHFRDARKWVADLKKKCDPKKQPVMMCCTGGIRCELMSALMKEEGFTKIYQLHGGMLRYSQEEGSTHWMGKLFVFDDRLALSMSDKPLTIATPCHRCQGEAGHVYNCANMDCNELFFACEACLQEEQGCCGAACQQAPRVRPLNQQQKGRPFRKWYRYLSSKTQVTT